MHSTGCIHGRFQPFHYGHVDYFKKAFDRFQNIVIGLTAVSPVQYPYAGQSHRIDKAANPLTYFERLILIRSALGELGIEHKRVEFVPFPIDQPEQLKYILPKHIICATPKLYEWNDEKIRRLKMQGYTVHILEDCVKMPYNGSMIRRLILENNPVWKTYVLQSVATLLETWGIYERLWAIQNTESVKTNQQS